MAAGSWQRTLAKPGRVFTALCVVFPGFGDLLEPVGRCLARLAGITHLLPSIDLPFRQS